MKQQRASVSIDMEGTPEQIRMAYRQILDAMDDMTDIPTIDSPTWACSMAFDLDEDWRKPHNPAKVKAFLNADLDGYLPRK